MLGKWAKDRKQVKEVDLAHIEEIGWRIEAKGAKSESSLKDEIDRSTPVNDRIPVKLRRSEDGGRK